ncbi:MAG: EFR1 family ferrodoxin [Eubacteriales bacterium]
MSAEIYYFSGTGNTLFVAKDIASGLSARLIPIAALEDRESVKIEADVIGIVYPVYYGELPLMVKRFAGMLENVRGKYIFAIATFGGSPGTSIGLLGNIIKSKGGELGAAFGVHMPQNAFLKPWETNEATLIAWKKKAGRLLKNICNGKRNSYPNAVMKAVIFVFHNAFKPLYKKSFIKYSGASPDLPLDDLIRLTDRSYRANSRCTGCGICAKVCPCRNIEIKDGKPVWQSRCETCLACYNWCPERTIEGGVAKKNYYYKNSHIALFEMTGQKEFTV